MAETNNAASSPAEIQDPFYGGQPTAAEMHHYWQTNEVPEKYKPASAEPVESAPTATPEQTVDSEADEAESAGGSETPKVQHQEPSKKPRTGVQRIAHLEAAIEKEWAKDEPDTVRIGQLNATIDKIRGGIERKTEPAPVAQPKLQPQQANAQYPQSLEEWEKQFDPDKWQEAHIAANPSITYPQAQAAMFSHMLNMRDHFNEQRRQEQEQQREFAKKVTARIEDARQRFGEEFESVIKPTYEAIRSNPEIHDVLKSALDNSDLLNDLMCRLGKDSQARDKFYSLAKSDAFGAIKYIGELEATARQELSGRPRNDKGQFSASTVENERPAPEPRKTNAPKPPTPVSGGASRSFDVNDDTSEINEWRKGRQAQVDRRGK